MKRIALIEDDADIAYSVALNLERDGYRVEHFANGQEGLLALQQSTFDFLILDLNLPDLDGFTICRELRRERATRDLPILILTARTGERDRVTGLDLGADDYLVKPFSMRELTARVAAILRRSGPSSDEAGVYDDGELRVEETTLRVFVNGAEVRLARKEFELLWLLIRNRPAVVSRERILTDVWRMADDVESRTLDAHVRNLRKKIGKQRISTVIGTGYRFEPAGSGGAGAAARG
ncbi:MAG TPA: response regulator transcription factor [Thermoanaerobaculia bacterium]|nr:response regulator transcription factor [Thermoanaerobaculia bacterium]